MYQTKTIAGILEPVAQQVNLFNTPNFFTIRTILLYTVVFEM